MRFINLLGVVLLSAFATALPTNTTTSSLSTEPFASPSNNTLNMDPYTALYNTKHLLKRGVAICKTTPTSPTVQQITVGIVQLEYVGGVCRQHSFSGCSLIITAGAARISICGPWWDALPCTELARGAKEVRDRCNINGRAAGQWDFNDTPVNAKVD